MVSYLGRVDGVGRRRSVHGLPKVAGPLSGRWRAERGPARSESAAGIYGGPLRPLALPLSGCRCVLAASADGSEALPNRDESKSLVQFGCPLRTRTSEESLFIRHESWTAGEVGSIIVRVAGIRAQLIGKNY